MSHNEGISRRSFIAHLLGGLAALGEDWTAPARALAQMHGGGMGMPAGLRDDFDRFTVSQLSYRGGDWDPDPTAWPILLRELEARTSIDASPVRRDVAVESPELFDFPFLYVTGHANFTPWSDLDRRRLAKFLDAGGFLLADDCAGIEGDGFDAAIRRELAAILPEAPIRRLSSDHPAYRAFYIVRSVGARRLVKPYLEGIEVGGRTAVILCANDLGCAWERDSLGNWIHPCLPGGESQRRDAFHLGINIVMYALTGTYKADLLHKRQIEERMR
jgi:hypothetical protein